MKYHIAIRSLPLTGGRRECTQNIRRHAIPPIALQDTIGLPLTFGRVPFQPFRLQACLSHVVPLSDSRVGSLCTAIRYPYGLRRTGSRSVVFHNRNREQVRRDL